MFGWIIPTPLAMPLTVTGDGPCRRRPGSSTVVVATFVTESVVRSAIGGGLEAGVGRRRACGTSAARPAATLSSGSRVPMTPVERWSVVLVRRRPVAVGERVATARWSASPAAPVAAFAQPLVETTASAQPNPPRGSPDVAARCGPRQADGRGRERVRREDRGRGGRTRRRDDEGEVRPTGGLDPGRQPAGAEAGGHGGASLDRREDAASDAGSRRSRVRSPVVRAPAGSCSRPAVSGRPWTRLNDWTAWPAAPLTRLSSTPIAMIRPVRSSRRT